VSGLVDGLRWELRSSGPGEVKLVGEGGDEHLIRLGDAVRADAVATVGRLKALGLRTVLLTGDHEEIARRIAGDIGVDEVVARLDPAAKGEWVRAARGRGHRVLFAGDGLNDGPAIAAADVGIAMGTGAASSVLVADGVVSSNGLAPLLAGIRAARAGAAAVRANQAFSLAYNVLAVTAAAAGWVNPLVAAVLMPLSSVAVIWGASRVEAKVRRDVT
jgi:P-type E1-E2 ATPase